MNLNSEQLKSIFTQDKLDAIFPAERSNQFFEALFGDAEEGAYDIRLAFKQVQENQLLFDLELHVRPGKCLACNLTYGLPTVFERHPIINVKDVVERIGQLLDGTAQCTGWQLGRAKEMSRDLHAVPLIVDIEG